MAKNILDFSTKKSYNSFIYYMVHNSLLLPTIFFTGFVREGSPKNVKNMVFDHTPLTPPL